MTQPQSQQEFDQENVENIMMCARWLVHQFENIECITIARLFQKAIDDSEAWLQTMAANGNIPLQVINPIADREARLIHNILVKYASIDDPAIRDTILSDMSSLAKKHHN